MDNKYPSKYSNGKQVTAAQFITEIICERKANTTKEDLHYRFWIQKKWQTFYKNQIGSANKLLKNYPAKAIIKALNTETGKKIYSLRAPHLPAIIEQQAKLIEQENKELKSNIMRPTDAKFGNNLSANKKNIISKLKDIDYGS